MTEKEQLSTNCQNIHNAMTSLFVFYLQQDYNTCRSFLFKTAIDYITLSNKLLSAFPNDSSYNPIYYTVLYLKGLKKHKDLEFGEYIFNNFELHANTPKDAEEISKLRDFFCKKRLT